MRISPFSLFFFFSCSASCPSFRFILLNALVVPEFLQNTITKSLTMQYRDLIAPLDYDAVSWPDPSPWRDCL